MGGAECKSPCVPADPIQDTVQVNPTLLHRDPYADKPEDSIVGQSFKASRDLAAGTRGFAAEQAKAEEEARAEEEQVRIEREIERGREAKRVQEKIQHEHEEAERQRREKDRVEQELVERKELGRIEQERRAEEERLAREQREAEEKVQIFLKANGFKGVNEKRKKVCSSSYALHCAVAQNSVEIVQSLLRCGADPKPKNSAGQTPLQLAEKCNKKGTHDRVLQELKNLQ